jgi:purine-binding chemotaxis protein CheW
MAGNGENDKSFILFELAGTAYAISSQVVQQIEMVEHITPVPNAPDFVDGVVFVRGQVVPIVNLRVRFGFPRIPCDVKSRVLVVMHAGRTVGLLVDSAREFMTLSPSAIAPPPEAVTNRGGKFLAGIAQVKDRLILILDVAELFTSQELPTAATTS